MPADNAASVDGLRALRMEVDCRIEHGAESGGHLEFVRDKLDLLVAEDERLRESRDRAVAALDQAVEALDIATEVIQSEGKLPQRAILSDKLLTATRALRATVAAGLVEAKPCGCPPGESCDLCD